ncbi:MAG: tetratricopeptide repeat protein [Phycisphaerae bacterium]|nr:tetratricopeptide repeat protein [Phycisphaerae bacterium]
MKDRRTVWEGGLHPRGPGPAILKTMYVLTILAAAPVTAGELTRAQQAEILDEATRAFDRGAEVRGSNCADATAAFREAAGRFQLLVDAGIRNGKLYYNLGNACFESGQIGRAILNYRRAKELIPGDGRLEHNLQYARSLRRNQIEVAGQRAFLQTLFFWHYGSSLGSRYRVGLAFYVLFWLMVLARSYLTGLPWRYALVPVAAAWLVLGVSVGADLLIPPRAEGVILADNVVVRKGNGERFDPQFRQPLCEGMEFVLLEQRRDWWCIELPDGKSGWIRADQAELL